MHRHYRDLYDVPVLNTYTHKLIDPHYESNVYYAATYDEIPIAATNGTLDTTHFVIPSSSVLLTEGYIDLGIVTLASRWTLDGWFCLTETNSPIFSIDNTFSILYNKTLNQFECRRYLYGTEQELFILPYSLTLNTWYHLAVTRDYNTIKLYVNLTEQTYISNFFYKIDVGQSYIGKIGTNVLTANVTNLRLINQNVYPINSAIFPDFKYPYIPASSNNSNKYEILHFLDKEYVNGGVIAPFAASANTYFDRLNNRWNIAAANIATSWFTNPNGLIVSLGTSIGCDPTYTLEFSFSLPEGVNTDVVLYSNWQNIGYKFYYFLFRASDSKILFSYFRVSDATIQTVEVGSYVSSRTNFLALQRLTTGFEVFLNGYKAVTNSYVLPTPISHTHRFNTNVNDIAGSSVMYLNEFIISNIKKYSFSYVPYINNYAYTKVLPGVMKYNYHQVEKRYENTFTKNIPFTLSGSSTLVPGATNTYTINQQGKTNEALTYTVNLIFYPKDELTLSDFTVPVSPVITAGNTSVTFNLVSVNFPVNPFKRKFDLVITSKYGKQILTVTINDSRTLNLDYITGLTGYLDGYLTKDSAVSGMLPNLLNTHNGTTTGIRTLSDSYGVIYPITSSSEAIAIPEVIDARTIMFLYRELGNTASRSYVGHTEEYTFNGGTDFSLVGARQLVTDDYITALSLTHRASRVEISPDDSRFLVFDDNLNKLYSYGKAVDDTWSSTPYEIDLELTDANLLSEASLSINSDGTVFALGMKNGNNGEGVVQVWRFTGTTWVKDLHLGSPIPAPYLGGFGYAVAISENGLRLFASEIGSNTAYIFEKNTLWSATPIETFIGDNRFGFSLDTNVDGTLLAITSVDANGLNGETHIYRETGSVWSLETTLNYGSICKFNKVSEKLVVSNYLNKTVYLYQKITGTWTEIQTYMNSATNFGYSVSLSNNNILTIASPSESKLYMYDIASSWVTTFSNVASSYGYSISSNNSTIVSSNYADVVDLITNNPASVSQNIIAVRQKEANALLADALDTTDVQILTFISNLPLSIDLIGASKISTSLNGIFMGALFFNRTLSSTELYNVEVLLRRYLRLAISSF